MIKCLILGHKFPEQFQNPDHVQECLRCCNSYYLGYDFLNIFLVKVRNSS